MQQNSNQRILYLDLLRLVATFAVILLHVAASEFLTFSHGENWCVATVYESIVRWCVPVFVMISGVLFLNPNKEITCQDILKKRVPRLLLAYVFWTVLYVLYSFVLAGFEGFTLKHLIRRSIADPCVHLWFLPMLIGVYLLIPILRKIAQDYKLMCYALIVWIIYISVGFLQFVDYFKLVKHFYSLFTPNSVVGYSGYFLLGYFVSMHNFTKKQSVLVYLLGLAGALVTILGTYFISVSKGEANGQFFNNFSVHVVAMAMAVFVMVMQQAPKYGKLVSKFVSLVRKDLFGIYLIHMLWINVVNIEVIRRCCSEIVTLPLIAIIVFVLSLFTTKLIRLVPILRKVVG